MNVVVVGASNKQDRFSNKAIRLLLEKGHDVIPVHPIINEIEGLTAVSDLKSITKEVDTVTLYVNPTKGEALVDNIVALKPKRVIMNPGTESELIKKTLDDEGIEVMKACTLVLLKTGQF